MKKLFTVLAVLLVASMVFAAGFSGSAKATYTFDFDARTAAYGKPGFGSMDVTLNWDTGSLVVGGEGDTHIEVDATASFYGWYNLKNNHAAGYQPWAKYDSDYDYFKSVETGTYIIGPFSEMGYETEETPYKVKEGNTVYAVLKLKMNTFKIVGKNWEVDFIGSVGLDFAKSAIDSAKFNEYTTEENVQNFDYDNSLKGKQNVAVTVFGYKFGFGIGTEVKEANAATHADDLISNDWTDAFTLAATVVTPEYDFNGVKFQAGAGYQVFNKDWALAGSAKAAYEAEKWSVSGAYDAKVAKLANTDTYLNNDLAVAFAFAPVAVDVYFNNDGAAAKDKYYDYFFYGSKKGGDKFALVANKADHIAYLPSSNYLSAKVVVDVAKVAENVPVTVTLTAKDIVNEDSQVVSVEAETTVVPNFKFGLYFNNMFDFDVAAVKNPYADHRKLGATVEFTGVEKLTLSAEAAYAIARNEGNRKLFLLAGAEYAHDLFTASAKVALEKEYENDAVMGALLGAKSTTLVAGAELSANAYFNLNNLDGLDDDADNKLVLACKVTF